ncbi:MAG: hypothetical protein ACOX1F_05725 [Erysipelotrichaceae bacterium]|jgi:hypothetical protein
MRTSGLLFDYNQDGSVSLGYEDYGVEIFGGYDYEVTYHLDKTDFEMLCKCLNLSENDNIKNALIKKFGYTFNSIAFEDFCKENKIAFGRNIHIG